MTDEWNWDDSSIPGESAVFRRVPARPNFVVPNLEGGPDTPAPGAFKCDPDGISTYRDQLLKAINADVSRMKKSSDDLIFGMFVADIRDAGAGVVDTPDPTDEELGDAHCSIRYTEQKIDKKIERRIREQIIESCWNAEQGLNQQT